MAKRTRVKPSCSKENQVLPPSKRFDYDMEEDDFEELSKGFVPPNTAADKHKCVRLFQEWAKDRNACFPGEKVPKDLLLTDDHQSLSRWLSKFCTEICKVDGTRYPPCTMQHYLLGIQRHIRERKQVHINLITDSDFSSTSWSTLCTASSILEALAVLLSKPRPSWMKTKNCGSRVVSIRDSAKPTKFSQREELVPARRC